MTTLSLARAMALLLAGVAFSGFAMSGVEQPAAKTAENVGPRTLEPETRIAVVRDYLAAWQSLSRALDENNAALLGPDFTGISREKLSDTIGDQRKLGLRTRYQDTKHDIHLVFYSPEGLSIQLRDTVAYDVQVLDHGKLQATQHIRTQYLAVLTPTEVRWKVRIFQSVPE
ncbi:MAG: hypothetical protein WAL32_05985 [Terriglobales bacterium]